MKKMKRRILSLILAVVLMAMACVVSAASISWTDSSGTHTLAVNIQGEASAKRVYVTNSPSMLHLQGYNTSISFSSARSAKCTVLAAGPVTTYQSYLSQALSRSGVNYNLSCVIPAGDVVTVRASAPDGEYVVAVDFDGKYGTWKVDDSGNLASVDGGIAPATETQAVSEKAISFAPYDYGEPYATEK